VLDGIDLGIFDATTGAKASAFDFCDVAFAVSFESPAECLCAAQEALTALDSFQLQVVVVAVFLALAADFAFTQQTCGQVFHPKSLEASFFTASGIVVPADVFDFAQGG